MGHLQTITVFGILISPIILHKCGGESVEIAQIWERNVPLQSSTGDLRQNAFHLQNEHMRGRPLFFSLPHQDLEELEDFIEFNRLRRSGKVQEGEEQEIVDQRNENNQALGATKNTTNVYPVTKIINDRFIGNATTSEPGPKVKSHVTSDETSQSVIQLPQHSSQYPSPLLTKYPSPAGVYREDRPQIYPKTYSFTRDSSNPVYGNPELWRHASMSSNAKSFFPLSIPVTKNYWGNIHQRTPREYSTASSIAYQQQLQPNSVIDKGIDQKEPSNSSFSVTSSYQHLQRREDPVKAKVQHPSFMEVLGGGAASVVTALLVNAGASFISDRTGLPLRRRRSAENSSAETDLVVGAILQL